jgi:hypothetical protein
MKDFNADLMPCAFVQGKLDGFVILDCRVRPKCVLSKLIFIRR